MEDENSKAMNEVESVIEKQSEKLNDITYELDGIHRVGFLVVVFLFLFFIMCLSSLLLHGEERVFLCTCLSANIEDCCILCYL